MKVRLLQSYYVFELTGKEMGKLRALTGIMEVVQSISSMHEVRGVIFTDCSIEVNIAARQERLEKVLSMVKSRIEEALI